LGEGANRNLAGFDRSKDNAVTFCFSRDEFRLVYAISEERMDRTMTKLLDSEVALGEGFSALTAMCPVMARLAEQGVKPPLRKRDPGFAGLANIVVSQQLSVASAGAIWKRLSQTLIPLNAESLLAATDETLRGCGLSSPKIRTLRAIATDIASGSLDIDGLGAGSAEAAHEALVAVKGIGPWTADIYLLFCLGHPDAFPDGDLALQEAAKMAFNLDTRPNAKQLADLAERWRPWRGVAAKSLWSFYAIAKTREGINM
jgi:DNA-3-methyladenine glycosylase II